MNDPEEPNRVAKIRARLDTATPGPWEVRRSKNDSTWIEGSGYGEVVAPAPVDCSAYCYGGSSRIDVSDVDAEFIAHAPTDVAFLLAEVERLTAVVDSVQALCADWQKSLDENSQIMTTAQRNAHLNDLAELSFVLSSAGEESR